MNSSVLFYFRTYNEYEEELRAAKDKVNHVLTVLILYTSQSF